MHAHLVPSLLTTMLGSQSGLNFLHGAALRDFRLQGVGEANGTVRWGKMREIFVAE